MSPPVSGTSGSSVIRQYRARAIDAHLAVRAALRLDADHLPALRADGDREALRILLGARQELTAASTGQTNRLRALLLASDDTDRRVARGALTETVLAGLVRRRLRTDAGRDQAVRQAEIRRLALALRQARRDLKANHDQLRTIVDDIAPGLTDRYGVGPVTAAQAVVSFSHPGRCRNEAAFAALAGISPLSGQQRQDRAAPAQPRRRSGAELRHPHQDPNPQLSPDPRLHRTTHRGGKDTTRDPPLPQALHRPRALPTPSPARCNRRTDLDKHRSVRSARVKNWRVAAVSRRDATAARRFFIRALRMLKVIPCEVVTDAAPVYPAVLDDLVPAAWHHVEQYANNPIEADHGQLKRRLRPMRGLQTDRTAQVVIAGQAFVQNLRRGHYDLAVDVRPALRLAAAFTEVARAI
jgi:hypothetical protein